MALDNQSPATSSGDKTSSQSTPTSNDSSAATTLGTRTAKKASGKNAALTAKPIMGKMKFPLTQNTERALRLAAILLEDAPSGPRTAQELIELATVSMLKKLRTAKGLDIPFSLLPE